MSRKRKVKSELTPGEWKPENWDAVTLAWLKSDAGAADRNLIKAAKDLLTAADAVCRVHNDIADEVDKGVVDAAFERWEAAVDRLARAVLKANGREAR